MKFATFKSVEDVMPQDMWLITDLLTCLLSPMLAPLMGEPIRTTTTSTPLWMITREMVCVKPGARIYEGGNVTIFFLCHVFFLISIVQRPYLCFTPLHEETDLYLLACLWYSTCFTIPL